MNKIRQRFHMLKFRTKLTIILFAAGLIPLIILAVYVLVYIYGSVNQSRKDDMNSYLSQACTAVEAQKELCEQMMEYLMHEPSVINFLCCDPNDRQKRNLYYEEIHNTISLVKYQTRVMEKITIYSDSVDTPYGQEIRTMEELKHQPWFEWVNKQDKWYYDEKSLEMVSIYRMPNYAETQSYIVIHSNIIELLQSLEQLAVGKYGVHVRGDKEIWNFYGEDCIDENGKLVTFQNKANDCIWVERTISYLNAKVVYFFPRGKSEDIFMGVFWGTAALIIFCMILIFLLGKLFSVYISKPLEMLTCDIQSMDIRTMETGVYSQREDEIGILIRSYNQMIKRIQDLIQENYETRLAQKEFEMKALQAQINPHFLYNSLSTINWKALEAGEKEISRIILLLSSFYRTTLNQGRTMNSIKNAIENIRAYLEIQLIMHDYNFEVHYDIDESLYAYEIPLLIFQPFVENALEHGLDLKEDGDRHLWISVYQEDDKICFLIRDNGIGMSEEEADKALSYDTKGYGIKNVNDRMKLIYGADYPVHITSRKGHGTSVLLYFPLEVPKKS